MRNTAGFSLSELLIAMLLSLMISKRNSNHTFSRGRWLI
ncbi:prepilin-type N-terminal cleavage/methylation domain-containing protein [Rheinheimera sp. D18]|nr:prepilin-type N-terminal cleavage/methylation domain-containing protein [Rheinheimera sp. D18]QBL10196.1 prepilin-type N-terminal cleavage/methylation domain-containing protein [Rheinheimera sp. D18]